MALNLATLMLLLLTAVSLHYSSGILSNNCQLHHTDLSKDWVFLTRPSANTFDALHTDYIKHGSSLYMYCDGKTPTRERSCRDGKFREVGKRNDKCSSRIRADTELSTVIDNSCRRLAGEMYNIVYNLPRGNKILLYQVCYSKRNEATVFTKHKAYGFNLPATSYNRLQFSRGSVVSKERADSFKPENVYKRFVKLLGAGQRYIPTSTSLILERGHMVNAQDFPSYDQMDETFKFINVAPQFRASNRINWRRIENWVHSLPAKDTYAEVVTGTYGVLRLPHSRSRRPVDIYLMENKGNPIPLWTYKVVKYNKICYAFVTLNNPFNKNQKIQTDICQSVACPRGLHFSDAKGSTVAYCCNYNHLARYVGNHVRLC